MRTPFFAHRSVQNKTWQFRGSRSIFALKNMQKNVVFWGIRKCVKIIIWTNKNSKFFVILITQKFHFVGWVNPVWGYIIFITSNRNYHKKCDSFCTFGNSLHGFFSRILGGLGGFTWVVNFILDRPDCIFSLFHKFRNLFCALFCMFFFLRSIFGLDFSPFFWPSFFRLDFMRKNTVFFAFSVYKCTSNSEFLVFGITIPKFMQISLSFGNSGLGKHPFP